MKKAVGKGKTVSRRPKGPHPPAPSPFGRGGAKTKDPAAADGRIRPLLERYCVLAGVKLHDRGGDLHELKLPAPERVHFRERAAVRVALSLEALEGSPGAEIAVLGSPFLANLVGAIRARGACRLDLGMIAPPGPHPLTPSPSGRGGTDLPIPVRNGTAHERESGLASHPIGRLLARVVLRAGAAVEEAIVESAVIDLSTGTRVSDEIAALFGELEAGRMKAAQPVAIREATFVVARAPQEMLQLLIADLREQSAERVAARQAVSETEVAAELERLDRYFASILADKTDQDEVGTITALHERRRAEEVRRYQVKAIVHPLQLAQARVLLQRAEWELRSARGPKARLAAQRALAGGAAWTIACPKCGRAPESLVVCVHQESSPPGPLSLRERGDEEGGHCACNACAAQCSVCQADFCADHGIAQCRVDDQPACEEHARVCPSCRMAHCSAHEGVCPHPLAPSPSGRGGTVTEQGHPACTTCLEACGSCGRLVCTKHAEQSAADAPKGSRRLCPACVRYCEGGSNEPVGVDEVVPCASCSKVVCTAHQSVCAVDGQVHCSRHLRRADGSGRLVCERHRAACTEEPDTIYASDEVAECASCGQQVCAPHSAECAVDQARHCTRHLEPLLDATGSIACAEHRKECHVDGGMFSLDGAQLCPVCAKDACGRHRATCSYCGRVVCSADIGQGKSPRCSTCAQLVAVATPPDEVVMAALAATGGQRSAGGRADRAWRIARDRTHVVVEVGLGWRRRTVLTLCHGETKPESVVTHSLVGSKRVTP